MLIESAQGDEVGEEAGVELWVVALRAERGSTDEISEFTLCFVFPLIYVSHN